MLDWAMQESKPRNGLILEFGLGNGRTYDHLRQNLPGREIYVFERKLARQTLLPDDTHLILGDIRESLPPFSAQHRGSAISSTVTSAAAMPTPMPRSQLFSLPIFCSFLRRAVWSWRTRKIWPQAVDHASPKTLPPPAGVMPGRYFIYCKEVFA